MLSDRKLLATLTDKQRVELAQELREITNDSVCVETTAWVHRSDSKPDVEHVVYYALWGEHTKPVTVGDARKYARERMASND